MKDISCSYLRLSVTDRCFFDCFYCGAGSRGFFLPENDYLSLEELLRLAKVFVSKGIRHIRLTGGEPLLRQGFYGLASGIAKLKGLEVLSLTTNGFLLREFLEGAGKMPFNRVNISLDTLKKPRFRSFTGKDGLQRVLKGIDAALESGIRDIRLNVLLLRGYNDDEIGSFVKFGGKRSLTVRFIEYFPTRRRSMAFANAYVPSEKVRSAIARDFGRLRKEGSDPVSGPAEYYRLGSGQRIGFISSVSSFFCGSCNRLRLTADGRLFPCLHSDCCADLKKLLRADSMRAVGSSIASTIEKKNRYNKNICRRFFEMSEMGG